MSYSSASLVAGLIPNILNGASDFTGLSSEIRPASAALVGFQSSGCALIDAKLASRGYTTPISATAAIFGHLSMIEAHYVAWQAELARGSPRTAAGERSRADQFRMAFQDGMKSLDTMDLSFTGLTQSQSTGRGWYVGGVSQSEKDSAESDSDRVTPRFYRGAFDNPDVGGADDQSD